jgi:prepilin-type N-terminal cleavage/methylation domain-containing protein
VVKENTTNRRGFTLIECAAGLVVLAILLVGVLVAYRQTVDGVAVNVLRERAMAVAERQMENLMASLQEPNSVSTSGEDEYDPQFTWELKLAREVIVGTTPSQDMKNTAIKATVVVECEGAEVQKAAKVELVRYFAYLKPLPGNTLAVPFQYETEEPQWITELREKLGREPTSDEIFEEMLKELNLSDEEMKEIQSLEEEEGQEENLEEEDDNEENPDEGDLEKEEEEEEEEDLDVKVRELMR